MLGGLGYLRLCVAPTSAPSFTLADNPIAHSPHPLTRTLSLGRVWATHAKLLIFPQSLSFDWSAESLPLIDSFVNTGNLETLALLLVILGLSYRCAFGLLQKRAASRALVDHHSASCISHQFCHDKFNNNVVHTAKKWSHCGRGKYSSRGPAESGEKRSDGRNKMGLFWEASSYDGCSPEHVSTLYCIH